MKFKNTTRAAALVLLQIFSTTTQSQAIFKKITSSPVTLAPGDSRSVNWVDIDNDSDLDLFISNGKQGGENNFLYKNKGKGNFEAVSGSPIVEDGKPSDGATWADYDNDGDLDCYVVNWYGDNNLLYRNDGVSAGGEVKFTLVQTGSLPFDGGFSETASWGDFDSDGWLDLYVSNSDGDRKNFLYKNLGNGAFEKITSGTQAVTDALRSRSVNWTDFDGDGDADLFVTNEAGQNENLYRNDAGALVKVTGSAPLINSGGKTMSSSWGDYDNDGRLDVFLANDGGGNHLFHNDGGGTFSKVASTPVSLAGNSFGSQFADVNNDGWLDLFVTNAFWGGKYQNYLFLNRGDGSFERNTTDVAATDLGWTYGCAFGDMDRDGDLDLAVAKCFDATEEDGLFENLSAANGNSWLEVELLGTKSNRSAIGAKVFLTAKIGGKMITQLREISAQSGHCGQNQLAAHFGLGKLDDGKIESLRVEWPSGVEQVFGNIFPNQFVKIVEAQGITAVENPAAAAAGLRVFDPSPNPFSHSVACRFELAAAADLQIEVVDSQGILVKKLAAQNFPAGENQVEWRVAGEVAGGVYFLKFSMAGREVVRALIKI